MTFIDSNASFGHWPFAQLPHRDPAQLALHLEKHGINQALVSPIETLFVPDPDPANRDLIHGCAGQRSLLPVPVLNLALPNWRESLDSYLDLAEIKAVKLYPNFHNYSLRSKRCGELVDCLTAKDIRLIINIRMEDERHQYHGLKVKSVSTDQLTAFTQKFPQLRFLCTGLFRQEILDLAEPCPNLCTDLSFADWQDLVNGLLKVVSPDRLFFGSHTPLMVTLANTYKLETSDIPPAIKDQIASANAKALFGL